MCVTNVYVDRYPSGREVEFRKLSICQYGYPGRPCANHSVVGNPTRKIQFGEATSEKLLTTPVVFPSTPPRSPGPSPNYLLSSSPHRYSLSRSPDRRHTPKPIRTHRKERIVIVDAPPTPRTPPQRFQQNFTAPSSPNPRFVTPRGRPVIVDERTIPRGRAPSMDAPRPILINSNTKRTRSRSHVRWDTPSTSRSSIERELSREREAREQERRRSREYERDSDALRRARLIRAQDEEIRRRPAIPFAPRPILKPVVDQSQALQHMMGSLSLGTRPAFDAGLEKRRLEREKANRLRAEAAEAEAQKQRLRERQMPKRRFSVGPGHRRHRVMYDDGVYRWE